MANTISSLRARMLKDHTTKAFPCKTYKTEASAEKALAAAAKEVAQHFAKFGTEDTTKDADYVVFFMPEWDRWVGAIDQSEILRRDSSTGGYIGVAPGFYKW